MPSKPDPSLHTVMHFLDRFVYRNARTKTDSARGSSLMQPMAGSAAADLLIKKRDGSRNELPLNSEAFWLKKSEDVAADEVFFHEYFNQSKKKVMTAKERKQSKKDEASDDEDEEEIWKALVNSQPDIEGIDEDEEGFSDVDDFAYEDDDMDVGDDLEGGDEEALEGADAEDSDGFDAADLDSGDDAFLDSDVEVDIPSAEDEKEEDTGKPDDTKGKVSRSKEQRDRKKKLKQLPTFASAEDYAKLLGDDDDE